MGFFKKNKEKAGKPAGGEASYKPITQDIIHKVKCPYQVFGEECTIEEVNDAYQKASQRGKQDGFVPVLVTCDDTFAEWLEILEDENYSVEDMLKEECSNGAELLEEYYQQWMEDFEEDTTMDEELDLQEFMGELEGGDEILHLSSFMKYTGQGIEETILFEIPVKEPWKVIAYLPMGGWNECPQAKDMMAICRIWYEKYGAVPAVITHDTLEFVVEKSVETEEEAWELAKEHYSFCPDRVDQGTASGTLGEVADSLRKSKVWYFWWD